MSKALSPPKVVRCMPGEWRTIIAAIGLLADCFFDPDTALCLNREGATPDRSAPASFPVPAGFAVLKRALRAAIWRPGRCRSLRANRCSTISDSHGSSARSWQTITNASGNSLRRSSRDRRNDEADQRGCYAAIEAAMVRLRSDDRATLSVARLASEAGLSRATLYRTPVLLDRFRAMLEQHEPNRTTARSNTDRIGELEAEIATLRARESDEMRDRRAANRNMAQHIQTLSLLVHEQERQIAKLQLELSGSTRVVPPVGLVRR